MELAVPQSESSRVRKEEDLCLRPGVFPLQCQEQALQKFVDLHGRELPRGCPDGPAAARTVVLEGPSSPTRFNNQREELHSAASGGAAASWPRIVTATAARLPGRIPARSRAGILACRRTLLRPSGGQPKASLPRHPVQISSRQPDSAVEGARSASQRRW